jgi:hypothetical protein
MPFTDHFLRWLREFMEPAQDRLAPKRFSPNNFRASSTGNDRTGTRRCGDHNRKVRITMSTISNTVRSYAHYFVDTPQGKKFNLDSYVSLSEAKSMASSLGIQSEASLDGDNIKVTLTSAENGIDAVGVAESSREAWALALGKAFEQATTPAPVETPATMPSVRDQRLDEARDFLSSNGVDLDDVQDIVDAAELAVACLAVLVTAARKQV